MSLKEGYVRTDTDGLVYKREDTFWAIYPDHEEGDPGILDAKPGSQPVSPEDYWEPDEHNATDPLPQPYFTSPTGCFYPTGLTPIKE